MTENDKPGTSGTPETGPNAPTPPMGVPTPPPYVPPGQEQPQQFGPAGEPVTGTPRGGMRHQEAGVTRPREATLAEKRARMRAAEEQREQQLAAEAEVARKAKRRKRLLIGGGVTVGVVALIAVGYAAASPDEVTAQCARDGIVVEDQYCDENYAHNHGGYSSGGLIFLPLPGGGYSSNQYHYGGSGNVGQRVSGGTTVKPPKAEIKTKSGATIQRGGFGVSGGSKSGGS